MKTFSYLLVGLVSMGSTSTLFGAQSSLGSMHITVNQRFWDDQRLSRVNGFSEWGAIGVDAAAGVYEFPYRIEPYVGVGFIRDTSNLVLLNEDDSIALDANGNAQDSADDLRYTILSFSAGMRQKFWEPATFWLIPFVQVGMVYRFGWVEKIAQAVDEQLKSSGGDFGADIGGGLILSFMSNQQIRSDLTATWDIKDFGLTSQFRYLPGGWFRHGLGLISGTSGWDFGLGLYLDW